ncbi:MlaE family ABC transporter permease [Candidatus Protofrankia californiensis]|uniref:MlaE family ABC transporter permease n=1 Tax=Candidatus Protofrankia californiensis TaxID=1839754 RepID=UPI001040FE22|nr:ABC transporter permease [Candidatus Protofrankia californiensis]
MSRVAGAVSGRHGSVSREVRVFPDVGAELVARLPSPVRRLLVEIGQLGQLLGQMFLTAVRNPRGYWVDTLDEIYSMLRYCWIPVFVSIGGFVFLMSNYSYNLVSLIGAQSRVSTYLVMAVTREISPFCTGMAVAGVMGAAMTADLGARRVREELDAMRVLGVDVVRTLVLPRVLAITIMTVAFALVGLLIGLGMGLIAATVVGNSSVASFMGNFLAIMTTPELIGLLAKVSFTGLFIGVICAKKGLTASGGPEGVGKAVNQAVVICFIAVWIINFNVNAIMLGLNPDMLVNR